MKKESFCFVDLDGTILDVSEKFYRSYVDILSNEGHKPLAKAEYWRFKVSGMPEREIHLKSGAELSSFASIRKSHIETPAYQQFDQLIPGAFETLEKLSTRYELVLVTLRHHSENLKKELVGLGIDGFFRTILAADPASQTQKSAIKVKLIRDEFPGFDSTDAVFIGDTEADILAGQQLGALCIAVTSGLRTANFLQSLNPDHLVSDIHESLSVLSL